MVEVAWGGRILLARAEDLGAERTLGRMEPKVGIPLSLCLAEGVSVVVSGCLVLSPSLGLTFFLGWSVGVLRSTTATILLLELVATERS